MENKTGYFHGVLFDRANVRERACLYLSLWSLVLVGGRVVRETGFPGSDPGFIILGNITLIIRL